MTYDMKLHDDDDHYSNKRNLYSPFCLKILSLGAQGKASLLILFFPKKRMSYFFYPLLNEDNHKKDKFLRSRRTAKNLLVFVFRIGSASSQGTMNRKNWTYFRSSSGRVNLFWNQVNCHTKLPECAKMVQSTLKKKISSTSLHFFAL